MFKPKHIQLMIIRKGHLAEDFSIDYENSKSWAKCPSSLIYNAHE